MADDLEQQSKVLWEEVKTAMTSVLERPLSPQEFYYLLSCYPYLELCDANYPYVDADVVPEIITAANGWRIFDYKSVLLSGNYELLARPEANKAPNSATAAGEEDDQGGDGTIVKQYTDIAFLMIELGIKKGWEAAEIISGFYPMQRMAWIASVEKGYELRGFSPSPEDRVVQSWVSDIRTQKMYPPERPFMPKGDSLRHK